jgi:hypothetical protein
MRIKSAALAWAALAALPSTSAVADIVTETYTGTVIGTDYAGYFGTAGLDLSNATFTATYVFDTNHNGSDQYSTNFIKYTKCLSEEFLIHMNHL